MNRIPSTFPAVVFDRLLDSFGAIGEMMIQLELHLGSRVDTERFARALDLALDAEPVLGCRYVAGYWRSRWERLAPAERAGLRVVHDEASFEAFKLEPIRSERGPQLRVCLWQREGGDRVLFKIGHRVGDTGALKEAAGVVADLYAKLGADPGYVPAPNLAGERGVGQVARRVPLTAWPRIYLNSLREARSNGVPLRTRALVLSGAHEPYAYVCRHLERDRVARVVELARARSGTINDALIAAFLRAIAALTPPDPKARFRLMTTVDLRRWYLPGGRGGAICNLSAFEFPNVGVDVGADFVETLGRVSAFSRARKASWLGLNGVAGMLPGLIVLPPAWLNRVMRAISRFTLGTGNAPNTLTNLGPIDPESVRFDTVPARAFLLAPPMYAPILGVGLSGYRGELTLSAAVSVESVATVERFFEEVVRELDGGVAEAADGAAER